MELKGLLEDWGTVREWPLDHTTTVSGDGWKIMATSVGRPNQPEILIDMVSADDGPEEAVTRLAMLCRRLTDTERFAHIYIPPRPCWVGIDCPTVLPWEWLQYQRFIFGLGFEPEDEAAANRLASWLRAQPVDRKINTDAIPEDCYCYWVMEGW